MEAITRIGRYTLNLTEEMGRMMLFVLSSMAWLTRPPFRIY
ncbi:ABC transporter permease, partial [Nitrospirales bacterium NOB]|nr:ABC transporter permease [Nitrospirales bacterium NOB]